MKWHKRVQEAERIGADSWELQNFAQLPYEASDQEQIEALKRDQQWQRRKCDETIAQIDALIREIQASIAFDTLPDDYETGDFD